LRERANQIHRLKPHISIGEAGCDAIYNLINIAAARTFAVSGAIR
jgi:hypothetical protein